MENNDIIEMKNLNDENLLELYDMVVSHLNYLCENLIDIDLINDESEGEDDE